MTGVSPATLKSMLHDGSELALIDVREAGEFGVSHLLFATSVPYSRLELAIGTLVPRKSAPVVLCDDGASNVALLAAKRLEDQGYADVSVLEGGTAAWAAAGYALFAGVNVPSKTFGELVEHAYHTPRVTARELARMQAAGEKVVVLDGRPYDEYRKMSIPGGICCPNGELAYRVASLVRSPDTKIVVNCAGRTRSIIGAQTLINLGIENEVYALENGTQGWSLADLELEHGAARRYPGEVDASSLPAMQAAARELMTRHQVPTVDAETAQRWLDDRTRTTYLLDVRTLEEYDAGSLPGAIHAPGGQLVQATDQWIGVRNARVIVFDGESIRAPVIASWLRQLGCDAHVLAAGIGAPVRARSPAPPSLPELPPVAAQALHEALASSAVAVFDLGLSMTYREAHVPGSRWSTRRRLLRDVRAGSGDVVLVADDERVARLAAVDLREGGVTRVSRLEGGLGAWRAAGYPVAASPGVPEDAQCIDYLFFVHDRHSGNREAMRQYLAWETGLVEQLDAAERLSFRVPAAH